MGRKPNPTQLVDQLDELIASLKVARQVVPALAAQARLERNELTGNLPTAMGGADYSNDPPPSTYADPTGEAVVNQQPCHDGTTDPARDLERLAVWFADVTHLVGSTRKVLNQAPAATLAVVDGRKPSDGRSAEEHAQRRYVHALSPHKCIVTTDHTTEDNQFGPGQIRRGMCNRHWMAWHRAARPDMHAFIARYRAVYDSLRPGADISQMDAYRPNLKEVI